MSDPWLKFYTSDWRADPRLKMCSVAARGLWIEMICLMHEATPYGHLLVAGRSPTDAQLAVLVGAPPDEIAALLGELEAAGVFSCTREGVVYSRKLTRMAKKAATARNNGRKGGNPTLGKGVEKTASDNPTVKGQDKAQKPEARSQIGKEREEGKPSSPKKRKSRLPEEWHLPKDWGDWACSEHGMTPEQVRHEASQFADHHRAKGNLMLDWRRAWQTWVRNAQKWAKPRLAAQNGRPEPGAVRMRNGIREEYDPGNGWLQVVG